MTSFRIVRGLATLAAAVCGFCVAPALAQDAQRPNILVIMADDVGYSNVGIYSHGMMVPTPNIDRIGHEGILFTDHYAQPSCTAGRASFITGQLPIRTGLHTVGMPGSPVGIDQRDPTLAKLLKEQGYRTGQFGKNHLGDRNEHLPTVNGFDEFYGNLYHLNTEEEPELRMWPKDPGFNSRYRPRGVLDCVATREDDSTVDPRFGRWGKQRCKDTGPLTTKRMETVDEEFLGRTKHFITGATEAKQPFFAWFNSSRMHIYTHLKPESRHLASDISSEFDIYGSGLMEHDGHVGQLLKLLDELKIADNTIVVYTTDNGAMVSWWPDARYHAFPRREGHHLGRWRARADAGALAGEDPGRQGLQRYPVARGHVHDAGNRGRLRRCARQAEGARQGLYRRRRQPCTLDRQRPRPATSTITTKERISRPCASARGSRTR